MGLGTSYYTQSLRVLCQCLMPQCPHTSGHASVSLATDRLPSCSCILSISQEKVQKGGDGAE